MNLVAPARQLAANRPLAALVVANGVSAIGDWLYLTVIPLLVYRETEDAALVGLAAAARLLPWLLLSLPAGVVADRVSGRHLLLVAESTRAVLMFMMTGLLVLGAPLIVVFGVALGAVAAGTFAMPAQGTLIPDLARDDAELGTANVLSSTFDNLACVVGPALAGVLILLGGIEIAFALNGLSFLVVVAVLVVLVRSANRRPSRISEARDGVTVEDAVTPAHWPAIVRDAFRALTMDAAISFAAGGMFILPVLIASAQSGGNDALVGILSAGGGIGGVVGALAAGAFVNGRSRQGLIAGTGVAVASFGLLAGSTAPVFAVAAVAMVSGAIVQLDTLNMTELQRSTASGRLGRTLGLLHTLAAAWVMAGSIVAGILAQALGVGHAILVCGLVVAALGGAALARPSRPVRSISLAPASTSA
jgi:predicted MFS family arabinose efflux permease